MEGRLLLSTDKVIITDPCAARRIQSISQIFDENMVYTVKKFGQKYFGRLNERLIKPGVYANKDEVTIESIYGEIFQIHANCISLFNQREYRKRQNDIESPTSIWNIELFICDLPKTEFWEGDIVCAYGYTILKIDEIEYFNQNSQKSAIEIDYPLYRSRRSTITQPINENDLKLVQRGPLWNLIHKKKLIFRTIEEEVEFFYLLNRGDMEFISNPDNPEFLVSRFLDHKMIENPNLLYFTKEQAIDAINNGAGHAIFCDNRCGLKRYKIAKFRNNRRGNILVQKTREVYKII